MDKKYDYTIYPENSSAIFKETCELIEKKYPLLSKDELLVDVDGSTIQIFGVEPKEIIVYDDYDIGAVYVKSDIDLSDILTDYWDTHKKSADKTASNYADAPALAYA